MQMICILLGVPEADRHELFEAVDPGFDFREGDATLGRRATHARRRACWSTAPTSIAAKRAHPTDDMLSVVVHATLVDVEPPTLTDVELYLFFSLLFAAGSETTRNAIAGGLLALVERPEQLEALRADPALVPTAIEEMLRWTTPSPSKRRTATRRTELARARDRRRATRSCSGRARPTATSRSSTGSMEFDIRRDPNPHLVVRPRRALLPRREPGPPRDARPVRGAAPDVLGLRARPARSSGRAATATPASATSGWSSPADEARAPHGLGSKGPLPIWSRTVTTGGLVSERRCQLAPSTTSVWPEMNRA